VTGGFPRLRTVDVTFEDVPMSLGKNREKRGRRVGREAQMILQFDSMPDQYPAATFVPDGEKTICELNSKLELTSSDTEMMYMLRKRMMLVKQTLMKDD
jgi:hypothetical protein